MTRLRYRLRRAWAQIPNFALLVVAAVLVLWALGYVPTHR